MTEPFRVLFVCTGNICRSPMAQAMLTHRLRERLGADTATRAFDVTSAGTYGLSGHPLEPDAVTALADLGVTPDPFAAREIEADVVIAADLVLTATREHRAAAVTLSPGAARRAFTVREFARLVAVVDDASVEGSDPHQRLAALVEAATSQRGYVRADTPADDDVADPYRRSASAFQVAAEQIDAATRVIADRMTRCLAPAELP